MNANLKGEIADDSTDMMEVDEQEVEMNSDLRGETADDSTDMMEVDMLPYPSNVQLAVWEKEVMKLQKYGEIEKIDKYIETVKLIPWRTSPTEENLDSGHAQQILDQKLIGNENKEKILGFLERARRLKTTQGIHPLIHGPPNAGKKLIGRTIACILDREVFRIDMHDCMAVADITGSDKPGLIIESLIEKRTMNLLIMLNRVNNVWQREDMRFVLSKLVERRSSFKDNYLQFSVDLSEVLIVCLASDMSLKPVYFNADNTHEVKLANPEYFLDEKVKIARILTQSAKEDAGIPENKLTIEDSAIRKFVQDYCLELGLKSLRKCIQDIAKKTAYEIGQNKNEFTTVTDRNLKDYLGQPKYERRETPVGVVRGLAYDNGTSSAFYIEFKSQPDVESTVKATGNLGNAFRESLYVAIEYAKELESTLFSDKDLKFNRCRVHINVPPLDYPKNGASGGIAALTAMMSSLLETPVDQNVAMTGELSSTGYILRVEGIRKKMIAAEREGATTIFLPKLNEGDYDKLPSHFKRGQTPIFVEHCRDVFKVLFPKYKEQWDQLNSSTFTNWLNLIQRIDTN